MSRAKFFREPWVLITIGVTVVVVLVWLFAFFLPQGKKISKLDTQEQALSAQQAQLNARVAELQKTSAAQPELVALQAQFNQLVPTSPDLYPYLLSLYNAVGTSGLKLVSIGVQQSPPIPSATYTAIPITLSTTGTYDQTLSMIKIINNLPRLTVISALNLTGGGPGSTRSTPLQQSFTLAIYYTAPVSSTPSTSTTG